MPRTKSIPLRIATMMRMIEYEIKQYKNYKFEEKLNFYLVLSELHTSQMALPIQPSKAGWAGTVSLVTLKGLDGNLIFLQIFNLLTI